MKKKILIAAAICLALAAIWLLFVRKENNGSYVINNVNSLTPNNAMKIESDAFSNNGKIPEQYSCYGTAQAIPLRVSGVPAETKSLAIIADDPDAPSGTFVHWVIWNIDPKTSVLSTDNPPEGSVQGTTSLGKPGFVAPCPPAGTHRYIFKLYALDKKLSLPPSSGKEALEKAMERHILENFELTGLYGRKN